MKRLIHSLTVVAMTVALATSVYAGACCEKAAAAAKEGQACVQCVKNACCKEAIKKLGDEAKPCQKCAKKSGEKKSGGNCPSCPK